MNMPDCATGCLSREGTTLQQLIRENEATIQRLKTEVEQSRQGLAAYTSQHQEDVKDLEVSEHYSPCDKISKTLRGIGVLFNFLPDESNIMSFMDKFSWLKYMYFIKIITVSVVFDIPASSYTIYSYIINKFFFHHVCLY